MQSPAAIGRLSITAGNELTIEHADGQRYAIHPIWLRERCQDASTLDLHTGQRLHDPSDLDPKLAVTAVTQPESGKFRVQFSDGHQADFLERDILAEAALRAGDHDLPAPRLWDATLKPAAPARWNSQPGDAERAQWLAQFLELGFVIFSEVPRQPGQILHVASVFGFTRETNFGELFDVRSTPAAIDLAYTAMPLDPHTDNPYRWPVPGVQLLHCLVNQTSGGLSTLVDGFAVAEALRVRDAEAFRLMSHTPVRFRYRDADADLVASAAPIELDVTGRVQAVHFSPRLDFVPLQPPADLDGYYRARRAFDHLLRSPEFEFRFLLNAGELVMMDNRRLLHGRTGFDPAEGLRHLQGCYIDIDGPRSLYRLLRRRRVTATEDRR
ncbi:MAG TPA: TauD/TfdA family dioxygenase [Steroidobacteraceae bacterium]|jgi:gamma-butyrobetaine dioxygenase|nr:TauD/TfdA family dioxygenase [Steroidobacteraceae bacterium]